MRSMKARSSASNESRSSRSSIRSARRRVSNRSCQVRFPRDRGGSFVDDALSCAPPSTSASGARRSGGGDRRDFELVPSPQGAEGIVAMLTVTSRRCLPRGRRRPVAGRRQLRRRRQQHRPRGGTTPGHRRRQYPGRAHAGNRRDRADADAVTAAAGDRGRPIRARRTPWQFSLEFMLGRASREDRAHRRAGRIGRETARLAEAFGAHVVLAGRDDDARHAARRRRTSSRCTRRSHRRRGTSSTRGVCG